MKVWDRIKINLDGFCCNELLRSLCSLVLFYLFYFFSSCQFPVCSMNLKHMSKYSKTSTVVFDACISGVYSAFRLRVMKAVSYPR